MARLIRITSRAPFVPTSTVGGTSVGAKPIRSYNDEKFMEGSPFGRYSGRDISTTPKKNKR